MTEYSTQEVARLLDLSVSKIRSFARAGLADVARSPRGKYRFSFQDVILMRTAKELSAASIHPRKIYSALRTLKAQLPAGGSLSAIRIVVEHDQVLVQEQDAVWHPQTGQAQLSFSISEMASEIAPLICPTARESKHEPAASSHEWFARGLEFELAGTLNDAQAAYERALALNPKDSAAHINLGRLLQDQNRLHDAEAHYRQALATEPNHDAVAAFNLGTVLEALGHRHAAIEAYQQALKADPGFTDAHYNLSGLFEDTGNRAGALRHLLRYKALQ